VRLHQGFPSDILDNKRNVVVYLPPSYDTDPKRKYPVLYLQDGQNVFDYRTSAFQMDWALDDAAERLIAHRRMAEIIMVGIYNTEHRFAEYTPPFETRTGRGRADEYGRFIVEELKPFIDRMYRTRPARRNTGILGSSLGGLCALYLSFEFSDVFGVAGAVSPSLWWGNGAMTRHIENESDLRGPDRLWLDMGTEEGKPRPGRHSYAIDQVRRLRTALEAIGYQEKRSLFYLEAKGGVHNERSWAERGPGMLTSLFPHTRRL
jgi:predicted alpha/beta superfamily hydrolase